MKAKWFSDVFLPSLIQRLKQNTKYHDRVILSDKQYAICERNMNVKNCYGDYGDFYVLVYETDTHKFQATQSGRYNFLYIYEKAE